MDAMRRLAIGLALIGAAALPATARAEEELVVVQANVGNVNVAGCSEQVYKLCLRPVEQRARQAFADLKPDVVAFQEILPDDLCQRAPSRNPNNLCSGPLQPRSQVERLLGSAQRHRCDDRFGWDCIAVGGKARLGRITTRPIVAPCTDTGFTLPVGYFRIRGWPVTVSAAHPDSTRVDCRTAQLRDFFEKGLPDRGPAIVMGDFNLDPYRENDASVQYWKTQVPARFRYASSDILTLLPVLIQLDPSGQAPDVSDQLTLPPPFGQRTIDHVLIRDGVSGTCQVRRVDGGGGMDHRAQVCRLRLNDEVTPERTLTKRGCRVRAELDPTPPWLRGIYFRTGSRTFVDRKAPYELPRRGDEKRASIRVAARALLPNGRGPRLLRTFKPCAR